MTSSARDFTVGVVWGGAASGPELVAQLNDDTFFDFTAFSLSSADVDTLPEALAYDALILGDSGFGDDSGYSDAMLATMRQYLDSGRGIVTVGWYNYVTDFWVGQKAADGDYITPIADAPYSFDSFPGTVEILGNHPIVAGISDFSYTANFWEYGLGVDANATQLAQIAGTDPSVAIAYQDTNGRSVYLGGLYLANVGYQNGAMRSGVEDQLLEQAVAWAAIPAPGALALLALGGVLPRRRRR
ncbi:MAG: hypothetical protein ACYS0G_08970 [Planctomycetota bacterium]